MRHGLNFPHLPLVDGWAVTGSLNVPRSGHTAILLRNGMVLAYGGYDGSGAGGVYLHSAELFNSSAGTWALTGSTFYERYAPTANLLANGKVLVAGGTINTNTELYDPGTGEWYATGRLNAPRPSAHASATLADGKVLVVGGYDQTVPFPNCFLSSAEIYDPATQVWTPAGSLSVGRYGLTATTLHDGKVLVVGGGNGSTGFQYTAELFDPATGTWTLTGGLFHYRFGHTATLLQNGKVMVTGGLTSDQTHNYSLDSTEIYDPASGNWYSAGKLNVARRYHVATLLSDGKILVTGGLDHDFYSGGYVKLNSAELFDPATLVWTLTKSFDTPRTGHTSTLLPSGKALIAGGDDANIYSHSLDSAELFGLEPVVEALG